MGSEKPAQNRIRELRTKVGLSQKKLAIALNISDTALQNYEYQKRTLPGDVLAKMADFFDVSADYILMTTDDPKRYGTRPDASASQTRFLPLSHDEEELLDCYRAVEPWEKELILNHAKMVFLHVGNSKKQG